MIWQSTTVRFAAMWPRTFWEWVLVLFVVGTAAVFAFVPLLMTGLFVVYGY
jgi:hypothetical protein